MKDFKIDKPYKLLAQFDAYYCDVGRVTVNPGAEFKIINCRGYGDGKRVYFLNSQNYLPSPRATDDFIQNAKAILINKEGNE